MHRKLKNARVQRKVGKIIEIILMDSVYLSSSCAFKDWPNLNGSIVHRYNFATDNV